jgi:hypothetical protein
VCEQCSYKTSHTSVFSDLLVSIYKLHDCQFVLHYTKKVVAVITSDLLQLQAINSRESIRILSCDLSVYESNKLNCLFIVG